MIGEVEKVSVPCCIAGGGPAGMSPVLRGEARLAPPLPVRLLRRFPVLRRLPGRLIGIGFRPEHVKTPAARTD